MSGKEFKSTNKSNVDKNKDKIKFIIYCTYLRLKRRKLKKYKGNCFILKTYYTS